MDGLSATPDELCALMEDMFPVQYDRAKAQLMIIKQEELIDRLQKENESLRSSVVDSAVEAQHAHPHEH